MTPQSPDRGPMLVLIVLSGMIISLCMGLRQSLGLFMQPMGVDLGITAGAFGFSIALQNIVWGVSQPFAGALSDRYGPRPVIVVTALLFSAGLLMLIFSRSFPGGLLLAGFLLGFGTTGFSTLYGPISRRTPPEKRSQTVGLVAAPGSLGLIGLFNAIGTFIFGQLGARYSQKHLLALIYLLRTLFIALFLIAPISAASTLIFASAMGFLWLGVTPLVTGIIARVFGLAHFNSLFGVVFLSHQVGSFFGAWMGGVVFDLAGNYNFAWGALIAIGVAAFPLQWLMDESPPRQRGHAGGASPVPA